LIIYAPHISERLRYIVQTLLGDRCVLTDSITLYQQAEGFHINYSDQSFAVDHCRIQPHGLLNESGTHTQQIRVTYWQKLPVFFQTAADLPFDIFAAAFYLISRYEEYLPFTADTLGRFPHTASLANRAVFLNRPLVNEWLLQWKQTFPELQLKQSRFQFQPTFDVDIAYQYRGKSLMVQAGQVLIDMMRADTNALSERWRVWMGQKDPFDQYSWLNDLHRQLQSPLYFVLAPGRRSSLDKQVSRSVLAVYLQTLSVNEIAIHPSTQAYRSKNILSEEITFLTAHTGQTIRRGRQHYLLLSLPETYRQLIDAGIEADYSMGYSTANGFRASYAMPFYWYDLSKEQTTHLQLFPFACMDSTCIFQLQLSPVAALREYLSYLRAVHSVAGYFATVMHPHLCIKTPFFEGYRQAYIKLLAEVSKTS